MAVGSTYQGAWQQQSFQGAWQQQSLVWSKTLTESFSMSDVLALDAGKVFSESLLISDVAVLNVDKVFAETLSLVDSITLSTAIVKAFADNLSVSDSLVLSVNKIFSESFSLVDGLITLLNLDFSFAESFSLSDVLALRLSRPFTESLGITDDVVLSLSKSLAENLGLSDTVILGIGKALSDNLSLTDVLQNVLHIQKSYSETFGIADNLVFGISKNLAETLNISDSIALVASFGRVFAESFSISDSLAKRVAKPFAELQSFSDSLFKALVFGGELVGNKEIARILADASSETAPWMTYIAIGESDIAEDEVHDAALYDEIYRKAGTVWVVRNTFFIKATFGQDEPTGDGFTVKEVGIFDDPVAGILGRRWVLDSPVSKDNLDEIVVECAVTILRGSIASHAKGLAESMGMIDSLAMSMGFNKSFAESLPFSEVFVKDMGLNLSESFGVSDGLLMQLVIAGPPAPIYNDVVVDGDYLYTVYEDAVDGGGILVFDISDPTNPSRCGWLNLTAVQADAPKRMRKSGNWLYTSDRHGVRTINVASPSGMFLGQELVIVAPPGSITRVPTVALSGTNLYHLGYSIGLSKYDISDPMALSLSDTLAYGTRHFDPNVGGFEPYIGCPYYSFPWGGYGAEFQGYGYVYTDGSAVYASSIIGGVWKMGLSGTLPKLGDPGNLSAIFTTIYAPHASGRSLAHVSLGGDLVAYCNQGILDPNYGYIRARYTGGHYISPGYVPSNIIIANSNIGATAVPANGYAKFEIDGTEGYIVGRPGLVILTLATGAVLNTIVGVYRGHCIDGNYLFAAQEGSPNHVDIYDISSPATPVLVGTAI